MQHAVLENKKTDGGVNVSGGHGVPNGGARSAVSGNVRYSQPSINRRPPHTVKDAVVDRTHEQGSITGTQHPDRQSHLHPWQPCMPLCWSTLLGGDVADRLHRHSETILGVA